MTSQKQPKKSPGRGPKGKTGTTGAGLRLQKGRTASTEEWLATGGKKIADRCAPVVVVEDALNAMRIIYNRHIIDPVVEIWVPKIVTSIRNLTRHQAEDCFCCCLN